MTQLGYTKVCEVQIQRIKHRIGFRPGTPACDLVNLLKQIPASAVVDEVIGDNDDERGVATIEFHEEKRLEQ